VKRNRELVAALLFATPAALQAQQVPMDRTILPVREPTYAPITELDARRATPPPGFQVTAPAGAPNVLLILLDDFGFGQGSGFGGPINMPTMQRLMNEGIYYNRFHVAALCSPTRVALQTGRNHHSASAGAVMDIATAFPGYTGVRPNSMAPLAEILRLNGYSTAAFGKYHETPPWEVSVAGPFDRWPTRSGYDKFYGFIGGETNQWAPLVYDGTTPVELPDDPNYHFMTDMTDRAITWVRYQQSMTPGRPFFLYFAPGATHAPHHVPREYIDRYRGRFDAGWDSLRVRTLANMVRLGIVPPGTRLAPKPPWIRDWSSLPADERRLFARQMEVYAGFGEMADHEIGRLVQAVQDLGELDNTLVLYIVGDNGASPEGHMNGLFNEYSMFNGIPESIADQAAHIDELGGPNTYSHYAAGWAVAGNAPFAYGKQVASDFGGTRNPLLVRWPDRIRAHGALRPQWHHVTDIAPTILEAAGIPEPREVNGTPQSPMEGVSMLYSFNDPAAPSRRTTQYFEIAGNRAIYHDGWLARTIHRAPWESQPRASLDRDRWELYNTTQDFSLATDLSAREPTRLRDLQALFTQEATRYHVLPLDDRSVERLNPAIAGRPDLMGGRTSLTLFEGMTGIAENAFISVKNTSFTVTADVEVPQGRSGGVILAQGGRFGGWALYFQDGRPAFTYNFLGLTRTTVAASQPLPAGLATIRWQFAYDGGGLGRGGTGTLLVNGQPAATGRIERTQPFLFSADEGADVGVDDGTPVTEEYGRGRASRFTGRIRRVTVETQSPPRPAN
jgi:arylsulfatase A-like enzyme